MLYFISSIGSEFMDFFTFGFTFSLVPLFSMVFIFVVWFLIFKTIITNIKRINSHKFFRNNVVYNNAMDDENIEYKRTYYDVHKSELAKFNLDDINILKDYFYNIFFEFENAYNNLDYNTMKILSTKQMYHNYHTGISLDLKVGKKRIINNIERKNVIIYELDSTVLKQIASVMIEVSYINYMIDKKGNVISGSRENKVTEKFEVIFRKDFEKEDVTKCPNCGANIVGNKCEYCRTTVNDVDFKISSIKKVIED